MKRRAERKFKKNWTWKKSFGKDQKTSTIFPHWFDMAEENITSQKGKPFEIFSSMSLLDFEPNLISSLVNHSSENIDTNLQFCQELQPYKPNLDSNKVLEQALIQSGLTEETISNWPKEDDMNYPFEIEMEMRVKTMDFLKFSSLERVNK